MKMILIHRIYSFDTLMLNKLDHDGKGEPKLPDPKYFEVSTVLFMKRTGVVQQSEINGLLLQNGTIEITEGHYG